MNNVTITINTVDTGGEILTYTVTGTAVNSASYSNISGGTNLVGNGANFDITINGLTQNYTVAVASPGSNYAPNQTIEISGDTIGGQSPANDLTITSVDVDNDSTLTAGGILTVSASGTAPKATRGYTVEDRLSIIGSSFVNGVDGTNDLIIRITSVDGDGGITNYSTSGTAPDAVVTYNGVASSTTGGGSNATFGVTRTGTVYASSIDNAGVNYSASDTLTILGTALGGTTANDIPMVPNVDGSGAILTFNQTGTAVNPEN